MTDLGLGHRKVSRHLAQEELFFPAVSKPGAISRSLGRWSWVWDSIYIISIRPNPSRLKKVPVGSEKGL